MKLVTHLQAVLLALGALSVVPVQAQTTCSKSSLSGDYSITITGAILAGPVTGLVNGVNVTHFDGAGTLTSVDHVVINGALATTAGQLQLSGRSVAGAYLLFRLDKPYPANGQRRQHVWVQHNRGSHENSVAPLEGGQSDGCLQTRLRRKLAALQAIEQMH